MAYFSTEELVKYIEAGMGEKTDGTSPFRSKILENLNRANQVVHAGGGELNIDTRGSSIRSPVVFPWALARDPLHVRIAPAIAETITITQFGTSGTLSAVSAADLTGYHLHIPSKHFVYKIDSHTAGIDVVNFDREVIQDDGTYECYLFQREYNFDRLWIPVTPILITQQSGYQYEINVLDYKEFFHQAPFSTIGSGYPQIAGLVHNTPASGRYVFALDKYPLENAYMTLNHLEDPAELIIDDIDPSDPVMPGQHRLVIAELALHYMLEEVSDNRFKIHLDRARELFDALVTENQQINAINNNNYGQIITPTL